MQPKAIPLKSGPGAAGRYPVVCAPLVGRTPDQLLAEAAAVAAKGPDLLEWRVDFFEGIGDGPQVVELASRIKHVAGGLPLLFTRRSSREGGERIAINEAQVVALYRAVCESGHVDIVDFEMSNDAGDVRALRDMARAHGVQLILSFHDFARTPAQEAICQRFALAESLGADIAKVAVMPKTMGDVLTLLAATLQSSREVGIPLVSMSMGPLGAMTRACGWAFGSALTFAVGASSSAPGQMAIEDVAAAIALLQKAMPVREL